MFCATIRFAIRSAKETILDVIGRPLDDQLRIEALNGYSSAGPATAERLQQFYRKTDAGRAGVHATPLPGSPGREMDE